MYKWGRRFRVEATIYHRIQLGHDKKKLFALLEFWKPDSAQDGDKRKDATWKAAVEPCEDDQSSFFRKVWKTMHSDAKNMSEWEAHTQVEKGRGHTPQRLSKGLDMTFWLSATRQSKARYRKVSYTLPSEMIENLEKNKGTCFVRESTSTTSSPSTSVSISGFMGFSWWGK